VGGSIQAQVLDLRAHQLDNARGFIAAGQDLRLAGPLQVLNNRAGTVFSAGTLRIDAARLDNSQKGLVGASGDALLNLGELDNTAGTLVAGLSAAGEVNPVGRATGYHAEFAADGAARIKPGATVTHNPNGTYEAPVQVFDAAKGEWVDKFAKSTFFPPSWSQARIEYEISEAFRNR